MSRPIVLLMAAVFFAGLTTYLAWAALNGGGNGPGMGATFAAILAALFFGIAANEA